ncbi:MAG: hypothetical protein AAF108_12205 [Planctomycetota bacterium]
MTRTSELQDLNDGSTSHEPAPSASNDFIGGPIRSRPSSPDPAWATDEQADGFWASVVRAYEDGSCS